MKKCPQCNSIYSDDGLVFCLADGTSLLYENGQQMPLKDEKTSSNQISKPGVSPIFAYLTVGLLALLIGGGIVGWLISKNSNLPEQSKSDNTQQKQPEKTDTTKQVESKVVLEKTPIRTQNTETNGESLTNEDIRSLIDKWTKSQDARSFKDYQSCYDISFSGIKRTKKGVGRYSYSQWMTDRNLMMSKADYLNIGVSNLQINIEENVASVEFDQSYKSNNYSDFGHKVMKIKMTSSGAKIIYEELESAE